MSVPASVFCGISVRPWSQWSSSSRLPGRLLGRRRAPGPVPCPARPPCHPPLPGRCPLASKVARRGAPGCADQWVPFVPGQGDRFWPQWIAHRLTSAPGPALGGECDRRAEMGLRAARCPALSAGRRARPAS
ncbi:hypothetical protein FJT64_021476 [Amphibalanus amphitrite]|uniref:Uncharacterized protein n=1 Tax=Amphibalanus amphitrite TaxID=1232801 RepID=A0A6A4WPD9_AMPAM|nr:hypothetical protein FJT64_021476 [Amphibalanus amphitrite]